MGTSAANKGSPSGVPLVPDWVPDTASPALPPSKDDDTGEKTPPGDDRSDQNDSEEQEEREAAPIAPKPAIPAPLAPPRRYHSARTSIGKFGESGDRSHLQSSLGHFISSGSGGASSAARRLGATSNAVGRTYDILSNTSSKEPESSSLSAKDLQECSTSEAKDRIIEAIQPLDGTQDTESIRESLNWAMNELLKIHEDAVLTQLETDQFDTLISCFISHEIYSHFMLEVGEALFARSGTQGVERANDVLAYVRAEVQRIYTHTGVRPANRKQAVSMSKSVLEKTFRVFEEYIL